MVCIRKNKSPLELALKCLRALESFSLLLIRVTKNN